MDEETGKIDTPEEVAAFEDFERRWLAINEEGERRNWLHWTGYESGPVLWEPRERENDRQDGIRRRQWAAEQAARDKAERKKAEQFEREQKKLRERIYGK